MFAVFFILFVFYSFKFRLDYFYLFTVNLICNTFLHFILFVGRIIEILYNLRRWLQDFKS